MKVLKQPEDISAWRQKCTCARCKAELEYEVSDVKAKQHVGGDMRESWNYWTYAVTCPCCDFGITVNEKDLSEYVKHSIQNKTETKKEHTSTAAYMYDRDR